MFSHCHFALWYWKAKNKYNVGTLRILRSSNYLEVFKDDWKGLKLSIKGHEIPYHHFFGRIWTKMAYIMTSEKFIK